MRQIEIPMSLPSRANLETGHWSRARIVARQRRTVEKALLAVTRPGLPITVLLKRISPRELDREDNLPMCLKGPRDTIARWLGLPDDRDPRCRWLYSQGRDLQLRPRYQALRITLSTGLHDCPCCGQPVLGAIEEMRP